MGGIRGSFDPVSPPAWLRSQRSHIDRRRSVLKEEERVQFSRISKQDEKEPAGAVGG